MKRRVFPYWKVQTYDATTCAWRDVQRAHYDQDAAWQACPPGGRLMEVTRAGRYPLHREAV